MTLVPSPVWPVLLLAAVSLGDAALCVRPVDFIRRCLQDVRFPRRYWRLLPPLKLAATVGLVAGIWVPVLGLLTCCCLIAYFVVAIGMHLRARDLGRNLFVNAAGMLLVSIAVTVVSFVG